MSFLIDTDLLSMLERKQVPRKLVKWIENNEADIFLSVVSFAKLQFRLSQAPATHKASLAIWLGKLRQNLAPATEELSEAGVGAMEATARGIKGQEPHDDMRGFFDCGHGIISRPHSRHPQQTPF